MGNRAGTVAEKYVNTINTRGPMECVRFWASDWCLVGGSIINSQDYEHLSRDFGILRVFSFETEHSDDFDKVSPRTLVTYLPFPDDGKPVPRSVLRTLSSFAMAYRKQIRRDGAKHSAVYLHCQQGRFRAPAMAWALVSMVEGRDPTPDILQAKPDFDPNHTYVRCAREFIDSPGEYP